MNKMLQITVEAVLWEHYKTKDERHPVKIRITYNRKSSYYPVQIDGKNVFVTSDQWKSIEDNRSRNKNRKIRETIDDLKSQARQCIQAITHRNQPFSFERFEKEFIPGSTNKGFFDFFNNYLSDLKKENRGGSYSAYNCALQAFKKFRSNKDLDPIDITPSLLRDFERYLKSEKVEVGKSGKKIIRKATATTVGIYMRSLRAVYNFTADQLPYVREYYPFARTSNERNKYRIQAGSGSKGDALTLEELKRFIDINVIPTSPEWRAKHLWLFSFYCNGMNFNDIARLKYRNIKDDKIVYVRQKTSRTEHKQEQLEIPINQEIQSIITNLGGRNRTADSFVFEMLQPDVSEFETRRIINAKLKWVNQVLKRMAIENGLPPITSYYARHTYASLLKISGESVELIREMLGHSDVKTTEAYLKRFDLDRKRMANEKLLALVSREPK